MAIQENHSTTVVIDGRECLYFGGTNYLSLAQRPELMRAGAAAFEKYGFSAGAGRLTSGESELLLQLESELIAFSSREAAVTLPAGYLSNLAVVEALEDSVDSWIIQPHAHGSVRSAIATSRKPIHVLEDDDVPDAPFRQHCNLEEQTRIGIFVEPINALTGVLTDAGRWLSLTSSRDFIIFDEAHSFGVLGQNGAGVTELAGVSKSPNTHASVVSTATFSKALGGAGGFIIGANSVVDKIKDSSNSFRGSTPLSPVACGAALESLRLIKEDRASTLDKLRSNIDMVNGALVQLGYDWFRSNVVPIYHLPRSDKLDDLHSRLLSKSIYVPSVGDYYRGKGDIGARWTIQAGHTQDQLNCLLDEIRAAIST